MQKYQNNVQNQRGDAIQGATVTVSNSIVPNATVTLYSDNGTTTQANPLTTDANGYFSFYARNGRYTLTISGNGIDTYTLADIFLQDIVSVKDYGATGGGVTDDSVQIQNAVNAVSAAGGGKLYIPPGTYNLGTAIAIPNLVQIEGEGEATAMVCTGNNFAFAFYPGNRSSVADLLIQATNIQTGGGGFDFTAAGNNIHVDDIIFGSKLYYGFNITPTSGSGGIYFIRRPRWNGVSSCNTAIKVGNGTNLVTDIYVVEASGTAATAADMTTWVDASNCDTLLMSDCLFIKGTTGTSLGSVGSTPTGTKFDSVIFDQMTGTGITVVQCRDFDLNGCSIQTCNYGLDLQAAAFHVRVTGGAIQNNGRSGVLLRAGARHCKFLGVDIVDNSTLGGFYDFEVLTIGTRFQIDGCTVGKGNLGTGNEANSIFVPVAASDYYIITNNLSIGGKTISDGGTGVNKTVSGNIAAPA